MLGLWTELILISRPNLHQHTKVFEWAKFAKLLTITLSTVHVNWRLITEKGCFLLLEIN